MFIPNIQFWNLEAFIYITFDVIRQKRGLHHAVIFNNVNSLYIESISKGRAHFSIFCDKIHITIYRQYGIEK